MSSFRLFLAAAVLALASASHAEFVNKARIGQLEVSAQGVALNRNLAGANTVKAWYPVNQCTGTRASGSKQASWWVFLKKDHPGYKQLYAALLAAQLSGATVHLTVGRCATIPGLAYKWPVIQRVMVSD